MNKKLYIVFLVLIILILGGYFIHVSNKKATNKTTPSKEVILSMTLNSYSYFMKSYLFEVKSDGEFIVSTGTYDPNSENNIKVEKTAKAILTDRMINEIKRLLKNPSSTDDPIVNDSITVEIKSKDYGHVFSIDRSNNKNLNYLVDLMISESPIKVIDKSGKQLLPSLGSKLRHKKNNQ